MEAVDRFAVSARLQPYYGRNLVRIPLRNSKIRDGPRLFAEILKNEAARWSWVVQQVGIKIE